MRLHEKIVSELFANIIPLTMVGLTDGSVSPCAKFDFVHNLSYPYSTTYTMIVLVQTHVIFLNFLSIKAIKIIVHF